MIESNLAPFRGAIGVLYPVFLTYKRRKARYETSVILGRHTSASEEDATADKKIERYLPKGELVFPMAQNLGVPCQPVVKKGDRVLMGQKLGDSEAFVSAPVLSSVSGTVKDIALRMTSAGIYEDCVIVENDNLYEKDPSWAPIENYAEADPKEYLKRIREKPGYRFRGSDIPYRSKTFPAA